MDGVPPVCVSGTIIDHEAKTYRRGVPEDTFIEGEEYLILVKKLLLLRKFFPM